MTCANSANVHVCNDKNCFKGELVTEKSYQVATIRDSHNRATAVGTVVWEWKDDKGKLHTFEVKDVLYLLDSPVNILSVTKVADQLDDNHGTGIDIKYAIQPFTGITKSTREQ